MELGVTEQLRSGDQANWSSGDDSGEGVSHEWVCFYLQSHENPGELCRNRTETAS